MNNQRFTKELLTLILLICSISSPIAAQRRSGPGKKPVPAPAPEPVYTFDTILPQGGYKVYSEVRNVGQLARSQVLNDLIEPIMKLAQPPQEFQTVLKWIQANADALTTSRMFAASWPTQPKLPSVLIGVEFATPEEAAKFESKLKRFMPKLMPKPSPSPASPGRESARTEIQTIPENQPAELPYAIKQTGDLVLLTDKPLVLRNLRPKGSRPMAEDPHFVLAHNRLGTESVFVYIDIKSIEREEEDQRQKWQREEQLRKAAEAANPTPQPTPIEMTAVLPPSEVPADEISAVPDPDPEDPQSVANEPVDPSAPQIIGPSPADAAMISIWSLLFGGPSKFPDALGVALEFEPDGYVLRALVIDDADSKTSIIPFAPRFISGPPITPGAASVMPADLDIFATVAVDYAQMYEGMVKTPASQEEMLRRPGGTAMPVPTSTAVSPFAELEKALGLKVKDDVLPLLGQELAIGLPKKQPQPSASPSALQEQVTGDSATLSAVKPPDFNPVIAVGIKDKEAVKRLLPKIIEGFGFKGANLFAQTERRGDAEIVSYANAFAYAFIGDYLVLSSDAATTKRAVESYLAGQTLSSDSHYRNFTRWQPRQVQGQIYAGPGVIDLLNPLATGGPVDDRLRDVMSRLNPVIDPMTYALFNDGSGPLHELHLPRSLLMFLIGGITSRANESPIVTNESIAQSLLQMISSGEAQYKTKKGEFGSLEELVKEGLVPKDLSEKYGYRIELTVLSNKFEATATPIEYGKTGRRSFFLDETNVCGREIMAAGRRPSRTSRLSRRKII